MKGVTKMHKKGLFIAIEGLDGAGTTTQADQINKVLNSRGEKIYITREPTDSMIGGLIRSLLKGHWKTTPEGTQLLFAADRAYHLEKEIIPILNKGVTVITDRYYFSSIAYGSVDIEDEDWIANINSKFLQPDLVVYIKVSAEEALHRIEIGRYSQMELFEKKESLIKVASTYDRLAEKLDYFVTIDGTQPKKKVTEDILEILKSKLSLG